MKTVSNKFRCNRGLTPYAFACGYIQRASATKGGKDCRVDLWHEGACYHVRAHEFDGAGRLCWECFDSLTEARKYWHSKVWEIFGDDLAAIAKDGRYSYRPEFVGEPEPCFVTRFCGEFVGKSDTPVGAMLAAVEHRRERQA